jgi:uncharacterized membrane protein YfcA
MERLSEKTLFVKWALLNAIFSVFVVALGITFGGRIHGAALAVIPIIFLLIAYASAYGGRLCWRADGVLPGTPEARRIIHESLYLDHWAWVCPMLGILSSIAGMSILLSTNDAASLGERVTSGGGAIFYGTFVGVLAMLLLKHEQRMIEHELDGG